MNSRSIVALSGMLLAVGALLLWYYRTKPEEELAREMASPVSRAVEQSLRPPRPAAPDQHSATRVGFQIKPKGKLTPQDVEMWIEARGRDITSLLGGYSVTKDPALLSEALAKEPHNLTVLIANALGGTTENKARSIERLKELAPEDAYPNILAAMNKFSLKDLAGAVHELSDAHGKPVCNEREAEFSSIQIALQQEIRGEDALRAYGNRNSYRAFMAGDLYAALGQELKKAIDMKVASAGHEDIEKIVALGLNISHRYTDNGDIRRRESGLAMEADFLKYLYGSDNIQILDKPLQTYMAEREQEAASIRQLSAILGRLAKENHPDYHAITQRAMSVGSLQALQEYAGTHPTSDPK